jgi:hypothetical protein
VFLTRGRDIADSVVVFRGVGGRGEHNIVVPCFWTCRGGRKDSMWSFCCNLWKKEGDVLCKEEKPESAKDLYTALNINSRSRKLMQLLRCCLCSSSDHMLSLSCSRKESETTTSSLGHSLLEKREVKTPCTGFVAI